REQLLEVGRQRRLRDDLLAGPLELQPRGVQGLAPEAFEHLAQALVRARRNRMPAAVQRVADQRMPSPGEVHADLVRAAGLELDAYISVRAEAAQHAIARDGRLAVLAHGHAQAIDRVTPDRRVDGTAAGQHAVTDGEITARDGALAHEPDELRVRFERLRDEQHAARVLVQPMHQARARQRLQLRRAMQQPVHQGAPEVAGARVHHEAGRLVHNQECLVLQQDTQRDRLGRAGHGRLRPRLDDHPLPAADGFPRLRPAPVEGDQPARDPVLEPAARILRKHPRQRLVETLARQLGGHGLLAAFAHGRGSSRGIGLYLPARAPRAHRPGRNGLFLIMAASLTARLAKPLIASLAAALVVAGAAGWAGTEESETDRLVRDVTEAYEAAQRATRSQN